MFIKDKANGLVFIRSKNIRVFPCGRRRSELIDGETINDRYYIPFDPEARLNTEANNRKHSGLNGFKQSFLNSWTTDGTRSVLSFVIAGYLFEIPLDVAQEEDIVNSFGEAIATVGELTTGSIYANIKLADITILASTEDSTKVLRDQSTEKDPQPWLDLLVDVTDASDSTKVLDAKSLDNYYFSGLSFSNIDLSTSAEHADEHYISLQLLDRVDDAWVIHEASRLPEIDHGDTPNSVNIFGDLNVGGEVHASTINATELTQNGHSVTLLDVVEKTDATGKTTYQLQFSGAKLI